MNIISHPKEFKKGIRVLFLLKRNKDGEGKSPPRHAVSYSADEFDSVLEKLLNRVPDVTGYRVYAHVDARNLNSAQLEFSRRKLAADFSDASLDFYRRLETHWVSSLSQSSARTSKYFLFDIDERGNEVVIRCVNAIRAAHYKHWEKHEADGVNDSYNPIIHAYATKNGTHVITCPFNLNYLPDKYRQMQQTNAQMLWGY
jgi:hypothetical protein